MTSSTIIAPSSATPHLASIRPETTDNLMDTLHRTGHFKHLMAAIKAASLTSAFNAAGPYTVFAPNDYAFDKLAKNVLTDLFKPQNKDRLTAILRLHMVPRRVNVLVPGEASCTFKSLQGEDLSINNAQGLRVNKARIVERDVEASNGIIHVIDTVLMPTDGG